MRFTSASFALYATRSCSLNASNCQRQLRRAARCQPCQHHRGAGYTSNGQQKTSAEPDDRQAQGRLQNGIHRARISVRTENYILATNASFGNLLLRFKFSCLELLFAAWRNADGTSGTKSWHVLSRRKHKGGRDLVHHLEVKHPELASLDSASLQHLSTGLKCLLNKSRASRMIFLTPKFWEQKIPCS